MGINLSLFSLVSRAFFLGVAGVWDSEGVITSFLVNSEGELHVSVHRACYRTGIGVYTWPPSL